MKKVNIVYDFDGTLTEVTLPRYLILEKCNYEKGTNNEKFLNALNRIKAEKNCETYAIQLNRKGSLYGVFRYFR